MDDQRESKRVPGTGLTVRIKFPGAAELERCYLHDISRGGMFLRTKKVQPVGTKLALVLVLPDGIEFRLQGVVVHIVDGGGSSNKASGMGIEFLDLTPDLKQGLADYVLRTRHAANQTTPPPAAADGFACHPEPTSSPEPLPPLAGSGPGASAQTFTFGDARASSRAIFADEDDRALLRRLCWLLASGGPTDRNQEQAFGLAENVPTLLRRDVYERMRLLLAHESPPAYMGEPEQRAVVRLLAMLESLLDEKK
jgi:uncharacterized protein (TIGR02266 family)